MLTCPMLTATWTAVVLAGALQGVGGQAPDGLTVVVADVGQGLVKAADQRCSLAKSSSRA